MEIDVEVEGNLGGVLEVIARTKQLLETPFPYGIDPRCVERSVLSHSHRLFLLAAGLLTDPESYRQHGKSLERVNRSTACRRTGPAGRGAGLGARPPWLAPVRPASRPRDYRDVAPRKRTSR